MQVTLAKLARRLERKIEQLGDDGEAERRRLVQEGTDDPALPTEASLVVEVGKEAA